MSVPKIKHKKICILISLFLFWGNCFGIAEASFKDTQAVTIDIEETGSLDMLLNFSSPDFNGPIHLTDAQPDNKSITLFSTENVGTMDFQYSVQFEKTNGDDFLCEALQIKAELNKKIVYNGNLNAFSHSVENLSADSSDDWELTVHVPESLNKKFKGKECSFNIKFIAWQKNFPSSAQGWVDDEILESNTIVTGTEWAEESTKIGDIVLNEFVPNPVGRDDAKMPDGEWIELFNNTDRDINVSGWYFEDSSENKLSISSKNSDNNQDVFDDGETIIPARGYLVVYDNSSFSLNNGGDSISLFNSKDELMDYYEYADTSAFSEGKTFARIPDGTGPWIDPDGTPGEKNELSEQEKITPALTENIFEENSINQTRIQEQIIEEKNVSEQQSENDILNFSKKTQEDQELSQLISSEGGDGFLKPETSENESTEAPQEKPDEKTEPVSSPETATQPPADSHEPKDELKDTADDISENVPPKSTSDKKDSANEDEEEKKEEKMTETEENKHVPKPNIEKPHIKETEELEKELPEKITE